MKEKGGMAEFVPVGKVSDLQPGHMKWVAVDRERVLLVNVDGAYYALKDQCGHQWAPLSRGKLQGHVVECPLHFACFDVRTGRLLSGPVAVDVPTYEVRIERETVFVKRGTHYR
jgi:nitrite reductase/ring-hydroxylating ferredoxin subunit